MKKILLIVLLILGVSLILFSYNKPNKTINKVVDSSSNEMFAIPNNVNGYISNKNTKWGFINNKGKVIIGPKYDSAQNSSEGLSLVSLNGKFGYVNCQGKLVIKNDFIMAKDFKNGLARVYINDNGRLKCGMINSSGNYIIKPTYDSINDFSEGLASVSKDAKYGFINTDGKLVININLSSAQDFSDGMSLTTLKNNKYVFINKKGTAFNQTYDVAVSFNENLAGVKLNNKWGFINTKGDMVIQPQYDNISSFSDGLASIEINNKWGFINTKGDMVIKPQYDSTLPFSNGIASVNKNNTWIGFINTKGIMINKSQYRFDSIPIVSVFSNGFSVVLKIGNSPYTLQYQYIDKNGKFLSNKSFTYATPFSNGLALVSNDNTNREYIDTKGKVIWKSNFKAPVASPQQKLVKTPVAPVVKLSPIDKIYTAFNIDKGKAILNSPKFKVSLNTTNVKVGEIVKVQVDGLKPTAKMNAGQVLTVERYADNLASNYATSNYEVEIHNFKTTNNQIETYIFVQPQEGDDKTYEYDFVLKLIP